MRSKIRQLLLKFRFYWFAMRWLNNHKDWYDSRQKYKALNKDWVKYQDGFRVAKDTHKVYKW